MTDGKTGTLVPPGEPRAVAAAVGSLATDRERLAEMGGAARDAYEAHPTWDDTVDRIASFTTRLHDGARVAP